MALNNTATLKTVNDSISGLNTLITSLSEQVAARAQTVDRDAVAADVAQAVAEAFAPFRTVVEAAGAQTAVADLSAVHVVGTVPAVDVFGVDVLDMKGQQMTVDCWNHPAAPVIDPDFIWTEPILRHLLLAQETGENLWFGGDKGTGKSETARQFAARTGRAFTRINFHKYTSAEEYVGAVGLKDGATVFEKKDFLLAYTCPSSVILLDEITNADPGELAPLNGFLEPKAQVSFGGQPHRRAPGVMVFAADNTFGSGDDSGRYAGTRNQNSALVDRFARVIAFKFLPVDQEVKALVQHTKCTPALARHVHGAIKVARAKVDTGDITDAPSIRSAMAFIRALRVLPPVEAWEATVVARQPAESHAVLRGIFETCISVSVVNNNL
jgi:MoxR-like ATPase